MPAINSKEMAMKKSFVFLMVVFVFMMLSGCTSLTKSQFNAPFHSDIKAPLKADIEIGEKISGTASATVIMKFFKFGLEGKYATGVHYGGGSSGVFGFGDPLNDVKESAVYDAVTSSNADVILMPRYVVEVNEYLVFSTITAKVTGYNGTT